MNRTQFRLSALLLLLFAPLFPGSSLKAQEAPDAPPPRTATVYTGEEPPKPFDDERYRSRAVESYPILQFLGARCTEITKLTATRGLFRFRDAHPHYPEYQRLPFDVYFQPASAPQEEIYHLNTGSALLHITLPMRYVGVYYVVIRDQVKPSALIVNSQTLEAEFRRCCALTESIIPAYLHRE